MNPFAGAGLVAAAGAISSLRRHIRESSDLVVGGFTLPFTQCCSRDKASCCWCISDFSGELALHPRPLFRQPMHERRGGGFDQPVLFQPIAMGFSHRQPMDLANLGAFLERASLAHRRPLRLDRVANGVSAAARAGLTKAVHKRPAAKMR
jgi:hypothetical protein